MTALSRPFFGWRVVGAAFVLAVFAWGISFYGPPIFLQVLHASRGWPVSVVSGAITAHFLLGAAVVANLAALHRRFGLVAVTRAGALLTALGLLGWAFAAAPWQLYLAAPISGAGWAMTSGAALPSPAAPRAAASDHNTLEGCHLPQPGAGQDHGDSMALSESHTGQGRIVLDLFGLQRVAWQHD